MAGKLTILVMHLCENCDVWYFTGLLWHDEVYCKDCYFDIFPPPPWWKEELENENTETETEQGH